MKSINKRTLVLTSVVILLPMLFGLALWNKASGGSSHAL